MPFGRRAATVGDREAEALATILNDPRRLGLVTSALGIHFFLMDAYDQAISHARRALALAKTSGDRALQAQANDNLANAYVSQGDYRRAIDCFGQTVALLDEARRYERFGRVHLPAVFSRAILSWCYAELGMFAKGRALGEEGLQIAETVAHPASLMWPCYGMGQLFLRQGDLPRAVPWLERAVGICRDADLPAYFPRLVAALGAAYTLAGRAADAVPLLTQALEQSMAMGRAHFETLCRLPLGEARALGGHLDEALTHAERALVLAREHRERGNQAYALRLLGEIAARHEPPETVQAEAHYRAALALAKDLGMRPLAAHCQLGLGMLDVTSSRPAEARVTLSAAIKAYRAMEMTWWLPQAEGALAQVKGR